MFNSVLFTWLLLLHMLNDSIIRTNGVTDLQLGYILYVYCSFDILNNAFEFNIRNIEEINRASSCLCLEGNNFSCKQKRYEGMINQNRVFQYQVEMTI